MAEFKTLEDMQYRATYLLDHLRSKMKIQLNKDKLSINYDHVVTQWLASELLEVYTKGIHDWIETGGKEL